MYFKPVNLRIDYGKTMIAANPDPVFSWGAVHEGAERRQAACRVAVYKAGGGECGAGGSYGAGGAYSGSVQDDGASLCGSVAVWDSGWVETAAQELRFQDPKLGAEPDPKLGVESDPKLGAEPDPKLGTRRDPKQGAKRGSPLVSGTRYIFTVRLRDNCGQESAAAESAFMTALFEEWDAPWIAAADDEESGVRYFRSGFSAGEGLARATLFTGSAGLFRASVNGQRCGYNTELTPAVSDYSKSCYYTVDDITDLVKTGDNCVGIILADGWRRNNGPYLRPVEGKLPPPLFGAPAVTAIVRLEYADGRIEWARTGGDWLCGKGPTVSSHLFDGEHYDARLGMRGWDAPAPIAPAGSPPAAVRNAVGASDGNSPAAVRNAADASDGSSPAGGLPACGTSDGSSPAAVRNTVGASDGSSPAAVRNAAGASDGSSPAGGLPACGAPLAQFSPAVIVEGPGGRLRAQTVEPIRETSRYTAVSLDMPSPGRWIYDFGQNIAGVTRLAIPAGIPPGVKITIRHAEILDEDGGLYTKPLRGAKNEDSYITGGAADVWQPAFTYHGFRYAELAGYPGVPDRSTLTAVALNTDVKNAGVFQCGNALVNAIQKMVVQTELANIHGILTDCPQRDERMGWMNDATVRFVETPNNFEIGGLFPKVVDDIRDEQGEDGAITCTAPFVYGSRPADPVCSSFLVAADMARIYTGNMDAIASAYPSFCAWNDFLAANSDGGGIVNYSYYGDWAGPAAFCLGENGARSTVTPGIYMSTGYHYYNSLLLAKFAGLLGRPADAARHAERAASIQKAFLAKWFDPGSGIAGTGSQGCQAFALWLGILPEEHRGRAAEALNRKVLSDGLKITTGNLTTYYLLDALAEYGYTETAWALLTRTDYPSWGFMHEHGATTVWERFELKKDGGMNSHSHPMYGAVGAFFYRRLCGVMSDATGFERFRVKPCFPAGLKYAQGVIETCRGDVRVMWHRKYGAMHAAVTVPFGAEAEIILPGIREAKGSGIWRYSVPE